MQRVININWTRGTISIMVLLLGIARSPLVFASSDNLDVKVSNAISNYYYDNEFSVTADEAGNVTLEGRVNSLYDKYRIFEITSQVPGVRTITNKIVVDTPLRADEAIKADLRHSIDRISSIVEPDRIDVAVDNGVVILSGEVSFYREKLKARTIASWQEGVKGVVDDRLKVLPPRKATGDENLKKILQSVLENRFPLQENVAFTIKDGIVTLNGATTSLWARRNIEEKFLEVLGIWKVINNLSVETS